MNSHIHYLDTLLVLIAIIFPATITGAFMQLEVKTSTLLLANALTYILMVVMVYSTGYLGEIILSNNILIYVIAIIMGYICILLEILEGQIVNYIKYGFWSENIEIHKSLTSKNIILDLLLLIIGASAEEIIFRQVFFYITYKIFGLNIIIVILLSSFIYGLNHIFFGTKAVLQKTITGIVYSLLFVISGYSIVIPAITHIVQNGILYIAGIDKEYLNERIL